jgi:hypothetical protein
MSGKVDLEQLEQTLRDYGSAYLLTVTDDQHPHAVAVTPTLREGTLRITDGLGRRTRTNLEARPDVTLLWPPREPGGYTLICDGRVSVDGDTAQLVPSHAVLHRPADHGAPSGSACGNDCIPVAEA